MLVGIIIASLLKMVRRGTRILYKHTRSNSCALLVSLKRLNLTLDAVLSSVQTVAA